MLYTFTITTAASTTEASADVTVKPVSKGILTRVSFRPRFGHANLCHCRVYYHEHIIVPTNPDQSLHGDGFPIEWDEHIPLESTPAELKIVSWNTDDTYAHTFDISFTILPRSVLPAYSIAQAISNLISFILPRRVGRGV